MENLEKGYASLIDDTMDVWDVPAFYRNRNVAKPTPYFEEKDARRILEEMEDAGCLDFKYDDKKGTFVYRDMGADEWQDVRTIMHDGKKLYAVGDDWLWEDTTDKEEKTYLATFMVYVNCSPRGYEHAEIEAICEEHAEYKANKYARLQERADEALANREDTDVWYALEELEEC